ncbi:aminotransferase class IV [Alkaliphilus pronyensis]|nr:aminotransferase class IV [Alkaliphilus pronyensis]
MVNNKQDIELQYYILNDNVYATANLKDYDLSVSTSVYEVIRVFSRVPLFEKEHLNRLETSISLLGFSYSPNVEELQRNIHRLIHLNKVENHNIKIVINNFDKEEPNIFLFFIKSSYPKHELYKTGVKTILYSTQRSNPNAKVVMQQQRQLLNEVITQHNAYEALLVDATNSITEGSRSNVFFVKDNTIVTAPSSDVLVGITRNRVIELCTKHGIAVTEKTINVSFLEEADGLFLTGTSPKILPISAVENRSFRSAENSIIVKLMNAYDELIKDYVNNYITPIH